jgi:hypothetical protein
MYSVRPVAGGVGVGVAAAVAVGVGAGVPAGVAVGVGAGVPAGVAVGPGVATALGVAGTRTKVPHLANVPVPTRNRMRWWFRIAALT